MIVEKPWGKVTTYALNQPSSVRIITIEPGQVTSEHYHQLRNEMWIVLDPGLLVQIGNRVVEAQPARHTAWVDRQKRIAWQGAACYARAASGGDGPPRSARR